MHILFIASLLIFTDSQNAFSISANTINTCQVQDSLTVSTNFEGGSARVLAMNKQTQTLTITPAGDARRGMPNWWYLRLDNIDTTKTVSIEVVINDAVLPTDVPGKTQKLSPSWTWPTQASFSTDGKTWAHTQPGFRTETSSMVYMLRTKSPTLWLAWGPPFTPANATAFTEKISKEYSFAKAFALCQSREGRSVPALQISEGNKPAAQRPAVWIHARQHAWECGSSWVGVGFVEWLVSDDEQAKWLRQNVEVYFVPIMDVDHVATGDGGKNALPQDHNRDWSEAPHWPEVAAAQKHVLRLTKENRMSILLDLHNPGPGSKSMAFYIIDSAYVGKHAIPRQERFLELSREIFGEVKRHNAKPPLQNPEIFKRVCDGWVAAHGNSHTVPICVETPWNMPFSTTEGYKLVGQKLGIIVEKLLREEKE